MLADGVRRVLLSGGQNLRDPRRLQIGHSIEVKPMHAIAKFKVERFLQ